MAILRDPKESSCIRLYTFQLGAYTFSPGGKMSVSSADAVNSDIHRRVPSTKALPLDWC